MAAPKGAGLAVSHTLSLLVVPSDHKLTVHRLAPGLPVVGTLGTEGDGPGQFLQPRGVCFPPWDRHTLLVAEHGNNRVQEVDPHSGAHVQFWGVEREGERREGLDRPFGLAASATIVVVSEWGKVNRVSAYDAASRGLLWRSGPATGAGDEQLILYGSLQCGVCVSCGVHQCHIHHVPSRNLQSCSVVNLHCMPRGSIWSQPWDEQLVLFWSL